MNRLKLGCLVFLVLFSAAYADKDDLLDGEDLDEVEPPETGESSDEGSRGGEKNDFKKSAKTHGREALKGMLDDAIGDGDEED
jgi:hypothetical protein